MRGYAPADYSLTLRWTIPLPFKLISKSNHKGLGRYLPAKYRVFEQSIARLAMHTCKRSLLPKGWVVIAPHFQNKRHCDLSNLPKSILDGLVKGGVFKDDKDVCVTVLPAVYSDTYSECEIWG
jgi:Holliday junction resolvase RusA-like endonuclease